MAPALALDIPSARKSRSARLGQLQVPPDSFSSQPTAGTESEEFDFSDVFGPIPPPHAVHQLASVDEGVELADWGPPELHFDSETLVICSRSHSLVGPSPRPSLSRQLSKFSFDEDNSFKGKRQAAAFSLDPKENIAPDAEINSNISNSPLEVDASVSSVNSRDAEKPKEKLGPQDFELKRVVGQGAFGKVFQVQKKGTAEIYAMKVMRKDKIVERNHAGYMKAERDILTKMVHPFIVQLQYSFQTKTKLYLILDFINGGHLFFQLYRQGMFSEDLARLYSAEIVCAVAHLHSNDIIHRDLKPENILLDAEGHVRLTDFGLAKEISDSCPSNSLCGTMEYMAPEIILAKGHGKAADWWSVGILLYEMVTGQPPFSHSNRKKLQDKIIQDKIKLPTYLTSDAHSLLKGLLQKDPSKRLGSGVNGSDDIRRHKWFKSINWKKLEAREIQPKFTPEVHGTMCIANFDEKWTTMPPQDSPASTPRAGDHSAFTGFSYIAPNLWLPCLDKSPSKAPF